MSGIHSVDCGKHSDGIGSTAIFQLICTISCTITNVINWVTHRIFNIKWYCV